LQGDAGIDAPADPAQLANPYLAARIEQALRATGYPALRHVHFWAVGGIAILRGAVPSYYMKQIAQAAVSGVPGVSDVHNELDVVPHDRLRD
jgi:osmotically-inducible protein OsmY